MGKKKMKRKGKVKKEEIVFASAEKLPVILSDSYTEDFFLRAGEDYPAITGKFRPIVGADFMKLFQMRSVAEREKDEYKMHRSALHALNMAIAEWDFKDDAGKVIEPTVENLGKLSSMAVIAALYSLIINRAEIKKSKTEKN